MTANPPPPSPAAPASFPTAVTASPRRRQPAPSAAPPPEDPLLLSSKVMLPAVCWRYALEQNRPPPMSEAGARGGIQAALAVSDTAIATSWDYRNFFERDGQRYSHLIDLRTGYPIQHDVVSVTVVHGSAMMADAWATALTIMGSAEAMVLAEDRGLAVYLLKRSGNTLEAFSSTAMAQWMPEEGS